MKEINKIVYQASDGKIFETKEECLKYEKTIKIVLLDNHSNVLEMNNDSIKNYIYIYIGNEKSLEFIQNESGVVCVPNDIGYWYWDGEDCEFKDLTEEIDCLTDKLKILNTAKDKIEEILKGE